MTKKHKLIMAITFMITSTCSGFIAAYLLDFYPNLEGFRHFFIIKAIISGLISFFSYQSYIGREKGYNNDY